MWYRFVLYIVMWYIDCLPVLGRELLLAYYEAYFIYVRLRTIFYYSAKDYFRLHDTSTLEC